MPDERLGALEFLSNSTRAREAHYRERAEHLRMMALDEPLGRLRHKLTDLAEQFEQLADRITIERRQTRPIGRGCCAVPMENPPAT